MSNDRLLADLTIKDKHVWRHLKFTTPTVQRIVIAMYDVSTDIAFGQTLHLAAEFDQRTQTSIGRVVKISSEKNEIRLRFDRMTHNAVQSLKRRRVQQIPEAWRGLGQTTEGAIQMQIGCMDKPELFHIISLTGKAGQDWSGRTIDGMLHFVTGFWSPGV